VRWLGVLIVLVAVSVLVIGCARTVAPSSAAASDNDAGASVDKPTAACEEVVPDCHADRLPDVTLSEERPRVEVVGALGPVNEPLEDILSFDQALTAAWREDGHAAETVQVVLGSADAQAMHWDSSGDLFYGIAWTGVCLLGLGGSRIRSPSPGSMTCSNADWGTIIDAHTGAFIVGGTG
jgi:hypothetical protein